MSAPDVERLRDALTELRALVKGECPSLLNEDSGGDSKLDMQIDEALALSPHPDPLPASADIAGRLATALQVIEHVMEAQRLAGPECHAHYKLMASRLLDEIIKPSLAAYLANPSGWIPVGERLPDYVIIGHGESYDTKFATEETLLDVLAGLIYYDPKEMPDEERAEWAARLADDDEWMSDPDIGRTKFTCGLGETDHIEIFRIVKPLPPPPQEGHSGRIYTAPEEVEAAQQHMREGKA